MSRKTVRRKKPSFTRYGASVGAIGFLLVAPILPANAQQSDIQGVGVEDLNAQSVGGEELAAVAEAAAAVPQVEIPDNAGVNFEFSASAGVEASDNADLEDPPVGEVKAVVGFAGLASSVTRNRSFILEYEAELEWGNEGLVLGDTGADLSYILRGDRAELELFADYFTRNVTDEVFEEAGDIGDTNLSIVTGTRTNYGYGGRFVFGEEAPLTFSLNAFQRYVVFDTTDPDAEDSNTFQVDGSLEGAVNQATSVRVSALYRNREEDDEFDSEIRTWAVGAGITRTLGNASTVTADIGWEEVLVEEDVTTLEEGIVGRLAFDRNLPNGTFGASLGRVITRNGPIEALRINREFEFPASSFFLEGGVLLTEGDTVSPLVGIRYERFAPDSNFLVSLTQDAAINDDDETVLNSVGRIAYTRDINSVSSYRAAISASNQVEIDGGDTTRRVNATLSYNRSLTDDVILSTGYEHSRRFETDSNERTRNTVFLRISRDFASRR